MKRKTLALAPLALVATLSQAAETVKIYNWSDYIAPDTTKNFRKKPASRSPTTCMTATRRWMAS